MDYVTDMNSMFKLCESLQSLYLSNWNISNVTDTNFMFSRCESLQSLDLSNWDVSNVMHMLDMFYGCTSLQQTYGMSDTELQEALKSGSWSSLSSQQSNSPQKIKF